MGASAKQEEAGLALHGAGGGLRTAAARNRGKELEEGEKDYFLISENSRDQTVKQR